MKTLKQIALALLLLAASFLVGWSFRPKCPTATSRVDTLVIRDTIRDTVLVPVNRYLVRIDTVRVKIAGDTVYVDAEVPIHQRVYQTDDYRAVVEGFRPELIAMEVYRQTHYITKIETVEVPDRKRWGIGLNVSYSAGCHDGRLIMVPTVGIGVQYNLVRW